MDHSTAQCLTEDNSLSPAGLLRHDAQKLVENIRADFSELFETLNRLGDLYGDTAQGAHARAAAEAAKRARMLADRLS